MGLFNCDQGRGLWFHSSVSPHYSISNNCLTRAECVFVEVRLRLWMPLMIKLSVRIWQNRWLFLALYPVYCTTCEFTSIHQWQWIDFVRNINDYWFLIFLFFFYIQCCFIQWKQLNVQLTPNSSLIKNLHFSASSPAIAAARGFMFSGCPSHSCKRKISETPGGIFFKCDTNDHLDSKNV